MPDQFTNARPYFDVTFPSSGDGFSIKGFRNAFAGLGFLDMIPLQPRAHNPADDKIMVRGRDASSFYNPVYYGDANQRVPFSSGDTPAFATPSSNPRIDIVYMTPSGDLRIQQGTEAVSPTLPTLAPSGDSRFPICAVWNKTTQAKIVNFEDKDSNSGDGYIYQDLRPWMRTAGAGAASVGSLVPVSPTGDAAAGTNTQAARADHAHQGVHALRVVGQSNLHGDVEFAGAVTQAGRRITVTSKMIAQSYSQDGAVATGTTTIPDDNTVPQNNEGDQYLTVNHTPADAANILEIIITLNWSTSSGGAFIGALFHDSVASALLTFRDRTEATGEVMTVRTSYIMVAGTTSAKTFNVRAAVSAGTLTVNGAAGAGKFGGTLISSIIVKEYKP